MTKLLDDQIVAFDRLENRNQQKYVLKDGSILYIVYNHAEEYAYQLLFSSMPLDRVRFDSMDKNWNVTTSPHHFHPRNSAEGFDSPMVGEPKHDIPIFAKLILRGELKDTTKRFDCRTNK